MSDHAGVYLRLHLDVEPPDHRQCEERIDKEIKDYMEFNSNEEVSPSVL